MNLEELRTFLEVIETGSLIAASRRLNVTQSTVTARINGLEDELGQKLIHRNKSGTELTSPGFKFKRYAEVMLQLWTQARSEVSLPRGFQGQCNVGLEFDLWRGLGEGFLAHVRAHSPAIAIALWPGEQRAIDRWLDTGLVDVAFCYAPQAGERFASRVLFEDELVMVSTHRDAPPVPDHRYVYVDHGDEFRRQHAEAFPGEVTATIAIASSDWAVGWLLAHGGTGYLPRRVLKQVAGLRPVKKAPSFFRRVYSVETAKTAKLWPWYEEAVQAACRNRTALLRRHQVFSK